MSPGPARNVGRDRDQEPEDARVPAHRRSRADRRPPYGGAGDDRRHRGLAVPAPLRLAQRLRLAARRRGRRELPHRPGGRRLRRPAALPPGHGDPGHPLHERGRRRRARRPHAGDPRAGRDGTAAAGPRGEGRPRAHALRARVRSALRLRPDGPRGRAGRRGRGLPHRRARADAARVRPRAGWRRRARRVRAGPGRRRGRRGPRVVGPPASPGAQGRGDVGALRGHRALLEGLARAGQLPRALAGHGQPLGHHPQAHDLRAERRAGGRAHGRAPRAGRGRAQLGLPLHLGPRRLVLGRRPARPGLHRGGRGVHRLARRPHPRAGGGRVRAAPDHVPHRRLAGPGRDHAGPHGRLPGLAAGAHRQRRRGPVPARHLRRDGRRARPGRRGRAHARPLDLAGARPDHRLARRPLGPHRGGHLGDARRPAAVRLRAAHDLGGLRPRDQGRAGPGAPGQPGSAG